MKIFIIVNVARQYLGEHVIVKVEKVFQEVSKAQEYLDSQVKSQTMKISTSIGELDCLCERNVIEAELQTEMDENS